MLETKDWTTLIGNKVSGEPAPPISTTEAPKELSEPRAPVRTSAVSGGNGSSSEKSGASETPWGISWAELLPTLRASAAHYSTVEGVVEEVNLALARSEISPSRLMIGGSQGRGTHSAGDEIVKLYAVYDDFDASGYVDRHQRPMRDALSVVRDGSVRAQFGSIEFKGLGLSFFTQGLEFILFAAGELYSGPAELLNMAAPENSNEKMLIPRDVHVQTTCEVIRTDLLKAQPKMYKDLVRVARKWRDGIEYGVGDSKPNDLLLELVMLEAYHSAGGSMGSSKPNGDAYSDIFRRFLSTVAAQSARGAHVVGGVDQPRTLLVYPYLYASSTVDTSIARGYLGGGDADLCIVDPAAPHIDVTRSFSGWSNLRTEARKTLRSFEAHDLIEALGSRLHHFSVGVDATLRGLRERLDVLAAVESSPRRWSGNVAFSEVHLSSDTWVKVSEIELRCLKWHINVRRSRSDSTGYSRTADVSLQIVGLKRKLQRTVDVDVHFQGHTAQLVFGPDVDHVLIAKRSEILRNREYSMQITVIA